MKKPTRHELLDIIDRLQGYIGEALVAAGNDRDPDRLAKTNAPLREALNLCILARSADPPSSPRRIAASEAKYPVPSESRI